ncbi:GCN5-related N-acetyltransferase [Acidisarcina polymorpha]|uniref:GCN5-related N-acetyltransferase n=1 Tax=Acidisarcina polymorpha TaxID=2211140 RepID=A0A2Z5FTU5_9BACT|nr:GNAT family acetyltransferase [Acidisarcina polymorpha]AXC09937.1 GCN5-related N-acetyltransferase [Acidisarcina polymorpha]
MPIRTAKATDEAAVVRLWSSCELVVSYNDPGLDFMNAVSSSCSDVLVYESEDDEISGAVMVGYDGHRGWLYYVAIAPHIRGNGIGRKMVEAAEHWLRARDVSKAQLLVRDTNPNAVSFYEHLGFESAPRVVMGKWLNKLNPS